MRGIATRIVIGLAAVSVATLAVVSNTASVGAKKPAPAPIANAPIVSEQTTVAFSPAANPAFKVNDGTACDKPNTSGHLWESAQVTATSIADAATTEVRVTVGNGAKGTTLVLNEANSWTATLSSATALPCSALNGSALSYDAKSMEGNHPLDSVDGAYPITQID
jgi:hypothetical protein